jgi:formate dehydrogenase major subunit
MIDGAFSGAVRAMFVLGENPMMSEPNQNHARHALEKLEFLVCQDIFINETGEMADVILPATSFAEKDGTFTNTDRRDPTLPGGRAAGRAIAPDWDILCDLGRRSRAAPGPSR